MAATRAQCWGHDSTRVKRASRLGSRCAEAEAATWRTFARVTVHADGSGTVTVTRNGETLHRFVWDSEAPKS